jgi:hypothetical protein
VNTDTRDKRICAHNNIAGGRVFRGKLCPDGSVLIIGGSSLANDGAIPPRVIVLKSSVEISVR